MNVIISGYDIISKIISDKDILSYIKDNKTIGEQYDYTIRTYIGESDFLRGIHPIEYKYDEFSQTEIKITYYEGYVRHDRCTLCDHEVGQLYINILLHLAKDNENLIKFINNINTDKLYLSTDKKFYGEIKRTIFDERFSNYASVMYTKDKYFGAYNPKNNISCNNITYYVDLVKLYKYVKKSNKTKNNSLLILDK